MPKEELQTPEQMQTWLLEQMAKDGKRPAVTSWPPPPPPEPVQPAPEQRRREKPRPRTKNPRFLSVVHNLPWLWRNAIRTMSLYEEEPEMTFTAEGFVYKSMDPQHISLFDFELPAGAFEKYEVRSPTSLRFEYESRLVPPSQDTLKPLMDKIYRLTSKTTASIGFDMDESVAEGDLTITLGQDRTTLNSLEPVNGTTPIPNIAFPGSFKVTGEALVKAIRDALWQERVYRRQGQGRAAEKVPTEKWKVLRDSSVRFVGTTNGFSIRPGDSYEGYNPQSSEPNPDLKPGSTTEWKAADLIDYALTGTKKMKVEGQEAEQEVPITEASALFGGEWLVDFLETYHPDMIEVRFGDRLPVCISESIQGQGFARFWLAPRVSS